MRITLRKKAFTFFVLFELCMLAIFGVMLHLLHQAEAESVREERAKRIIGETQNLTLVFTKAGDSVVSFCRDHDPASLKVFDEAAEELPRKCDWLREQFADTPDQLAVFNRVDQNARDMLKVMKKVRGHIEGLTTLESVALMERARVLVQPKLNLLVADALTLVEKENEIVRASPERARRQRESSSLYVKIGFLATTLMAVAALLAYFKDVIGRLRLMEDNTRRLARNKMLHPALGGTDEIAHLDSVFHDMAGALKEAQEVRKAFVAMVSHDLRSPLTSIGGFLELLEIGVMGDISADAADGVAKARANVERLIRLINDLLDLEKMESGTIKLTVGLTSMQTVLDRSVQAVSSLAQSSGVSIATDYQEAELQIDSDRLIQVVVNLLSNAIKFSPEGGTVVVRMIASPQEIEVRVIDQGRGVPEKYRDLIFERFKQVDETDYTQKGGTGLGLPICKAIVEQHGGSIGVDSEENKGSQFWFKLPRSGAIPNTVPSGQLVDSAR